MVRDFGMARRARELREALGISPEELALDSDDAFSGRTVRSIESGATPNLRTAIALARSLGVSLGELIGEATPARDPRLGRLEAIAHALNDADIAALTSLAERLASRPQPGAAPADLRQVDGIERATPEEVEALRDGIGIRNRAERLQGRRVADQSAVEYDAEAGERGGDIRRQARRRRGGSQGAGG